jgi:hypothetical protein
MNQKQNAAQSGPSNAQLCAQARQQWATMNALEGRRIASINEKGERVYMEDSERAALKEQAAQAVAAYCGQ